MLAVTAITYAAAMALLMLVRHPGLALLVLLPAGAAWVTVIAGSSAAMQLFLPGWVRARGLATFQMVLFGSQAIGALVWGLVAQQVGLLPAFLAAAAALLLGAATLRQWPLLDTKGLDREVSRPWQAPALAFQPELDAGPIMVSTVYTVSADREAGFLEAMEAVRLSRLRTGAIGWDLYREGEAGRRYVETFTVPSWDEHLRQHDSRQTGADAVLEGRAKAFSDPPPVVTHLFPAL